MKIRILRGGPCVTNCFLIKNEETKKEIIIDPAYNPSRILKESEGYDVEYIIITHAHMDHIMALDEVKNATGAKVVISTKENTALSDRYLNLSDMMEIPNVQTKADITVNDGDTLNFGDCEMKFIMTPGHTPGSMCVFLDNTLFTGDTLFYETIGRCDLPGGSQAEITRSIKEKLFIYPDDTPIYPGHGPRTSIAHEKQNNMFIF